MLREGLMTGMLQDTWKGIHGRLRAEHELVCVLYKCIDRKQECEVCFMAYVCLMGYWCSWCGWGLEDHLVSIVPVTFGLL